jgi:hypothetical protein
MNWMIVTSTDLVKTVSKEVNKSIPFHTSSPTPTMKKKETKRKTKEIQGKTKKYKEKERKRWKKRESRRESRREYGLLFEFPVERSEKGESRV